MDAKTLVNAMIAEYVTSTSSAPAGTAMDYRNGWDDALTHAVSIAYDLGIAAAAEYVSERMEDIRSAQA